MTSSVVVGDASAFVAMLLSHAENGTWAASEIEGKTVAAPELMMFECANIIRRQALAGHVTDDQASLAHVDLLDFPMDLWTYDAIAPRAWELRSNLSIHDASYIALAEFLGSDLITLDRRIAGAPGIRCTVRTP